MSAIPGQACIAESFPERFLLPIVQAERRTGGIANDSQRRLVAVSLYCRDPATRRTTLCGHLFECNNSPAGPDLLIADAETQGAGGGASVAKGAEGDFFVMWHSANCVRGRAFDAHGVPLAEPVQLFPDICKLPYRYEVGSGRTASDGKGQYIAAWGEGPTLSLEPGTVIVRKLDHVGRWLGQEFQIHAADYPEVLPHGSPGSVSAVDIAESGDIVLMTRRSSAIEAFSAYIVWLLDRDLRLVRKPVVATTKSYNIQPTPPNPVGVDAQGNFVAAWQFNGEGWLQGTEDVMDRILAQRFTSAGEPVGPEIAVSGPPMRFSQFRPPTIAVGADGRFTVVWQWRKRGLIVGQRFTATGERIGRLFQINISGPAEPDEHLRLSTDRRNLLGVQYRLGSDGGPQTIAVRVLDFDAPDFIRGDVDADDALDISDAVSILEYLFLAGSAPAVWQAADANDDEAIDVSDPIYLLTHLFLGGPAPPHPYPMPGFDPTP